MNYFCSLSSFCILLHFYHCCLTWQAYQHASAVIQSLSEEDINVKFLVQIDKLIRLLETPIFAYLRLQVNLCNWKFCFSLLILCPLSCIYIYHIIVCFGDIETVIWYWACSLSQINFAFSISSWSFLLIGKFLLSFSCSWFYWVLLCTMQYDDESNSNLFVSFHLG